MDYMLVPFLIMWGTFILFTEWLQVGILLSNVKLSFIHILINIACVFDGWLVLICIYLVASNVDHFYILVHHLYVF